MPKASRTPAKLVASACPIVFLDTCSILDVMRDLTRDSVGAHEVRAAVEAVTAMENGEIIGLVAAQVVAEFNDNHAGVEQDAKDKLAEFRARLTRMDEVGAELGAVGTTSIAHLDDHVSRARTVVDRLMKAAVLVRPGAGVEKKANQRSISARTPARKGQSNIKDCVVTETYLGLATKIAQLAPNAPLLFVSSNTRDYAPDALAKAQLKADFDPVGLIYYPNLSAAMHAVRTWRTSGAL